MQRRKQGLEVSDSGSDYQEKTNKNDAFNKCGTDHDFQYRNYSMTVRGKFMKGKSKEKILEPSKQTAMYVTGRTINMYID